MTQKEIIRKVLQLLEVELESFAFKLKINQQGFFRRNGDATFFYYFLIYNELNIKTGERGFLLEPYADINISLIEEYYKEVTLNTELKNEWDFITIGNSIADLVANPDGINRKRNQRLNLLIFEERDIQPVVIELLKQFKQVALPYFLANNKIKRVDELLNVHPKEYSVHMYNDIFRFIKGLIAAKLNNNANFDNLMSIYNKLIIERDMPEYCMVELDRLKQILPTISVSGK